MNFKQDQDALVTTWQTASDQKDALILSLQTQATIDASTITSRDATIAAQNVQITALQKQVQDLQLKPIKGVNIHTFNSSIYASIDTTIAKAKALNFTSLRVDVYVDNNGICTSEAKLLELISKAATANMTVYPMLNIDLGDVQRGYNAVKVIGTGFAKYNFPIVELGNEMSARQWQAPGDPVKRCIQTGDGLLQSDFDVPFMAQIGQCAKGIADGLKAAQPGVKIMLNAQWYSIAFMKYMIETSLVPVDIIAWHFYSNQWGDARDSGKTRIDTLLKTTFPNIPIIFNEVGVNPTSTGVISSAEMADFTDMLTTIRPYGVFVYQLADQSERAGKEAFFGLYDKNWNLKPAAGVVSNVL